MRPRRRLLVGAAALALVAGMLVAATRPDGAADKVGLEVSDRTTSTTRRSVSSTTSTSASAAPAPPSSSPSSTTTPPKATGTTRPAASTPAPTAAATTQPSGLGVARVRLTAVASLSYPIAMAAHPGDGSLWLATKGGAVCRLQGSACTGAQTVTAVSTGGEQGLLGITFNPGGSRFYASYTDPSGNTRVDEFTTSPGGAPDLGSRRVVYSTVQPEPNHNGGNVLFGPDGRLYLGLGDGGGAGDQHGAVGNGQDPATDLGKILRIDPSVDPPVVERWISGVRNPWRFSFDRVTGDLWVGDVGQAQWEEVTFLAAGAQAGRNLGWRCYEGTHVYSSCTPTGGHTPPIFEYSHAEGCSITGGYVYRGSRIPDLTGAFLFADYCDGEVRALTQSGGGLTGQRRLGVDPGNVVSFGQDGSGELYVLTPTTVWRVDPG